jgi:hypothetical protein
MKLRSLLILILVCTGLGLYIHFGIEKAGEKKEEVKEKESKLARGDLTQLQKVSIQSGEKKVELEKVNSKWRITSPIRDLAAQSKIDNLVAALGRFKQSKVILKKEELAALKDGLKQYSLDPAKTKIEYKTSDLAQPVTLFLGGNNPNASGVYAQAGTGEPVVLATMDLDYLGTQGIDDFREMRLITVDAPEYSEVEIQRKDKNQIKKMKFKKNEKDQWVMTEPYQLPIDEDLVRSETQKIGYIRANSFLSNVPDALKSPDIKIVVGFKENVHDGRTSESDSRPNGNEIVLTRVLRKAAKTSSKSSAPAEQYDYYGKSDKTPAASLAQFHYDNFAKSPEDFIRKDFDKLELAGIKTVTFKLAGSPELKIEKNQNDYVIKEGTKSKPGIGANVDAALKQIRSLHALKFLETFSKQPTSSSLTIHVENTDGKVTDFIFDFKKDASELWYIEGPLKMKYLLGKDPLVLKDFGFDALTTIATKTEKK